MGKTFGSKLAFSKIVVVVVERKRCPVGDFESSLINERSESE